MNYINELQKVLLQNFDWNKARIACLAQILQALICVRTVNLTQIALLFKTSAKQESSYRRIRRFFSNFSFDRTIIIPFFLALFCLKKELILILDRTNWKWGKSDINILLLSVAYKKISIPLYWSVSSHSGSSHTNDRKEVLKKVLEKIGSSRIQVFLADREFIGEEWFRFLKKQKIPFVIRIKGNTMAGGIRNFYQVPIIELWKNRGRASCIKNHPVLIWGHLLYVSIVQAKNAEEPLIVASNKEFSDAITLYRRRWEIETLFGCLKTKGFRMEDTRLVSPERIEKLLFVVSIAFAWSYKIGLLKQEEAPPALKAHGRLSRSFFRIGLDYLRWLFSVADAKNQWFRKVIMVLIDCSSVTWREK